MKIEVNGEPREFGGSTLEELLRELALAEARVATAVNGEFVPAAARAQRRLAEGDRVEVLAPMQGG
jgi:sulfur carrier protein